MRKANGVAAIRILAVCSAIALGGGYVWQRQKSAAVPTVEAPGERPPMPGTKSMTIVDEGAADPGAQLDRPVISGSKSGMIFRPGEEPKDLIVIPGVPPADEVPPVQSPVRPPRQRTVLPGSKSISRILENPERKPVDPAPPVEPEAVEPPADEP